MKKRKQRWSNEAINKLNQLNYVERLKTENSLLRLRVMQLERRLDSIQKHQELEEKIDKALMEMKKVAQTIKEER